MSTKSRYEIQLDQVLDAWFEELQKMPAGEVLAGESPDAVRARADARLARATLEAGRRRMVAARAQAAVDRTRSPITASIEEARAYIARIIQNANYTLAARQLEEMPDEEILRLYDQLRELENQ